jgi:hypothetical protein
MNRQRLELEGVYFSISQGSHPDLNTLAAVLIPLLKGGGGLIFGDGAHDLYPARSEAVLGQREASQLLLNSWKDIKVCCGNSKLIGAPGQR